MRYIDDLMHWVGERERIRRRKEAGEARPWTADPILQQYRFCNVDRNNDTVTKWIHDKWMFPHQGEQSVPFAMAVARMVNLPETLAELGYPRFWDPERFKAVLGDRKAAGKKVWTSAYMITGGYSAGGESKEVIIARVLDQAHSNLNCTGGHISPGDSLAVMASKIRCPGIGTFLSAQVVADLKQLDEYAQAKDWFDWCAPGPGSSMGLNFIHGRDPTYAIKEIQFIDEVNEIRNLLRDAGVYLCAQNTQNCLCELSKYIRAKYFDKRLKTRYVPASSPA